MDREVTPHPRFTPGEASHDRQARSSMENLEDSSEYNPLLPLHSTTSTQSTGSSRTSLDMESPLSLFPSKNPFSRSPRSSSTLLPYGTAIPHHPSWIPRKYYRPRVITVAVLSMLLFVLLGSLKCISWAIPEDVDRMQLASGMSLLRGAENPSSTRYDAQPAGEMLPPLYPEYFQYEESLFQHHAPAAPGTSQKFIHFANHVHLLGFNNHLEEYLLNAHLAYLTSRSFVFYEYTWNPNFENEPYSEWFGRKIPSRVPESVMLGGWLGGSTRQAVQESDEWDVTPVSRPYFERACPVEERVYIDVGEVMRSQISAFVDAKRYPEIVGKQVVSGNGMQILQAWTARLQMDDVKDAKCVEFKKDTGHAFDMWLVGSPALHALWPSLVQSPVLQHWSFSPLIYEAFRRNVVDRELLGSTTKALVESESANATQNAFYAGVEYDGIDYDAFGYPEYPGGRAQLPMFAPAKTDLKPLEGGEFPFEQKTLQVQTYPRTPQPSPATLAKEGTNSDGTLPILVLHLRRGDFEGHCTNLAGWGSSFMGFATFEEFEMRDKFVPPQTIEEAKSEGRAEGDLEGKDLEVRASEADEEPLHQRQQDGENGVAHGEVHVLLSKDGVISSNSSFAGHVFDDPKAVKADQRVAVYAKHCYPTNKQIVRRVSEVVEDWVQRRWIAFVEHFEAEIAAKKDENEAATTLSRLKAVYIMTNGDRAWAGEVREALRSQEGGVGRWEFNFQVKVEVQRDGGWLGKGSKTKHRTLEWIVDAWPWDLSYGDEARAGSSGSSSFGMMGESSNAQVVIRTARDLELTLEEKYVAQAVDMYIGQRAELFIGNGFSSMTANVVMLRKNAGLDTLQTRFW
ncbi:hypothetical protein DFP72DRAFT_884953 [Ephemerocybe angulata]|uniref:Uncharacterized protein n=1 Tax=Ephemerocybe angulata TaxID=980116 RepID=A0A8H6M840_9AGAR|nr:hypothetical protein DFP72DRAFT_884953 [Tulosesus angulatus]